MPSGATGVCGSSPSTLATVQRAQLGQRRAVEGAPCPPRGLQQPGQAAEQGRLAAGVGADDRGHLAVEQRDVEVADDRRPVVAEGQALGAQSAHPPRSLSVGRGQQPQQVGGADRAGDHTGGQRRRAAGGWRRGRRRAAAPRRPGRRRAIPPVAGPSSRLAIGPATSATKTIGPATDDRQGDQRRPRWRAGRRGSAPYAPPRPRAVSSPSSSTRSCRCSSTADGQQDDAVRRTGVRSSSALGLADRAGQPVHGLPGLEELGPGQHVADEARRRTPRSPMPIRMKR